MSMSSRRRAARRTRHVQECAGVSVSANVCLFVCAVCVSRDAELLTRTPLPTWGAGWCTRSPRTQTGRSSWPPRCNWAKRGRDERLLLFYFFYTVWFCVDGEKQFFRWDSLIVGGELNGLIGELGVKVVQPELSWDVGLERRHHLLLLQLKTRGQTRARKVK